MKRLVAAIALSALLISSVRAEVPTLSYVVPLALAPGKSTDVALHGKALAEPTGVWVAPSVSATLTTNPKAGTDPAKATCRFELPDDAPPGIYAVRLATKGGISNLKLLTVDDLPTVLEATDNKKQSSAQKLTLPVAVEGAAEPESYDYFRFTARAGQRLSVEVLARRLASPLDPVVRLLDEHGHELAYSDDEEATGVDGRFVHRFAQDGDYLLEIRDIRYQGGADFRYRLRIGDFPLVTAPFPLAVARGSRASLEVTGTQIESLAPLAVNLPASFLPERQRLWVRYAEGQGSSAVNVLASDAAEQLEQEPNDTPEMAMKIERRGAIEGRFAVDHDRDWYAFTATKGSRLRVVGRTRSLGSPADLYLRLFDATGKQQLAEAEDTAGEEGVVDHTFAADGTYLLSVEELLNHGASDRVYRLELEPGSPSFSLTVAADKFDVARGGFFSTKVTAVRQGFDGPIELSLEGLDPAASVSGQIIAKGKKDTTLQVVLPSDIEPGRWLDFRVVGHATSGEQILSASADNLVTLRTALASLSYPPAELVGRFVAGIGPAAKPLVELSVDTPQVVYYRQQGQATVKLKAKRLGDFAEALAFAAEGLPPGVVVKPASLEPKATELKFDLSGPAALAPGDYAWRLVGTATYKKNPVRFAQELALRVVEPLELRLEPPGKLTAGGKLPLKVRVTRMPGLTGTIHCQWLRLPDGIAAVGPTTIAEGANDAQFELAVAVGARPMTHTGLLVASVKLGDRELRCESRPLDLKIEKP